MIKRAMIAGLNSTGVDVADLRVLPCRCQPPPAEDGGLRRGLPRRVSYTDPEVVEITLLRAAGHSADLLRCRRRSRRTSRASSFGAPPTTPSAASAIRPACARPTRRTCWPRSTRTAIRARGFRIVVDYGYSAASYVLPLVLGPARCRGGRRARLRCRLCRRRLVDVEGIHRSGEAARSAPSARISAPSSTEPPSGSS